MAITSAVCDSFKVQALQSVHDFSNISLTAASVAAGTGVYTITSSAPGASNGYAGLTVVFAGFGTSANNGTFKITASSATTLTTTNSNSANSGAMGTTQIGDVFKLALYTASATMSKTTTNYVVTNEVGNSGTYAAGGGTLVSTTPVLSTDTACCLFATLSFTTATIAAEGCMIYNSSKVLNATGGAAVIVLDFGGVQTSTAGTFTITFPAQTAGNAILQLA